jgi:hypothetical protein
MRAEATAQQERDAEVAGEERVAAATAARPTPGDVGSGVHREGPRAVEPAFVAGTRVPGRVVEHGARS